ncbi:MAG: thiamine phosphate synthase, partial [Rhodospirillales bacterium]|nr:thiamine phosphate synthase [Rhodospirillales bacterium]
LARWGADSVTSAMRAGRAFDLSLYLVAGSADCGGRQLGWVVDAALRGGVSLVQLREKTMGDAEMIDLVRDLRRLLNPRGVPLIVNDRLEVALAAEAEGLHLGQEDLDPAAARAALGPDRILGVSAGDPEEAKIVDPALVDYVGVGPVYATGSKADAGAAIGPAGLGRMRGLLDLPMVAIGGIKEANVAEVMATGVEGVAVVSAICAAPDPAAAARALRRRLEAARPV